MPQDVNAVKSGAGTLYWDELDGGEAAFPVNPETAPAGGWTEIGYTENGWQFEVEPTYADLEVAESADPVGTLKTAQAIRMTGVLAQTELTLFRLAMSGGTIANTAGPPDFDTYTPPGSTDAPVEWQLLFRGSSAQATDGGSYDIQLPRVISVATIEMQHDKAPSLRTIGVQFRALVPSAGDIFKILATNSIT